MTEATACRVCGKAPLSKDEIGITKKLIDKRAEEFYCLSCLATHIGAAEEELVAKIREFRKEGCSLFE